MSNPKFVAPNYTTQTASQYKANIDAAAASGGADAINIGCSYDSSAGTFTIHDMQGNALTTANPGFIKFQDQDTAGHNIYISLEANQSFIDDVGSSEIINNLFGTDTTVAWGNDCPFYIYGVANDTANAVAIMISRVPGQTLSPAVARIGAPDDAVADDARDFFSFDNIDETLYDENPCTMIGSFRMQKSASDDWTVQALDARDGIGRFNEERTFLFPTGQNGADEGYGENNGGTAAAFTTNSCRYYITKNGYCHASYYLDGDGGTDGAGAIPCAFVLPINGCDINDQNSLYFVGGARSEEQTNGTQHVLCMLEGAAGDVNRHIELKEADGLSVLWADFSNGARTVQAAVTYRLNPRVEAS